MSEQKLDKESHYKYVILKNIEKKKIFILKNTFWNKNIWISYLYVHMCVNLKNYTFVIKTCDMSLNITHVVKICLYLCVLVGLIEDCNLSSLQKFKQVCKCYVFTQIGMLKKFTSFVYYTNVWLFYILHRKMW